MKYLCLAYEDENTFHEMPREEWLAMREEVLAYVENLRSSGHLLATYPLQSARTATVMRVRNGMVSATDGPFAETKEQIGGYFLIEVSNHEEALRIAAAWPSARVGSIEVRPIEESLSMERRYAPPGNA
jgi:hypothetical protein